MKVSYEGIVQFMIAGEQKKLVIPSKGIVYQCRQPTAQSSLFWEAQSCV